MASSSKIARRTSVSGWKDKGTEGDQQRRDVMLAEMRREQGLSKTLFFLEPQHKCPRAQEFDEKLSARIFGQENAIHDM
jgi:hypothetical protein